MALRDSWLYDKFSLSNTSIQIQQGWKIMWFAGSHLRLNSMHHFIYNNNTITKPMAKLCNTFSMIICRLPSIMKNGRPEIIHIYLLLYLLFKRNCSFQNSCFNACINKQQTLIWVLLLITAKCLQQFLFANW